MCLELEREPLIAEYTSDLDAASYIMTANLDRRSLTHEQKIAIGSRAIKWMVAERARLRELSGKSADGTAGGRGRKKNPTTNSALGLSEPKTRERDQRSTIGQIAEAVQTTRHKAAQAVRVLDNAPELLAQVEKGELSLREAAKQAEAKKPRAIRQRRREPSYLDAKTKGIAKLRDAVRVLNNVYETYPARQAELLDAIHQLMKDAPPPVGGGRPDTRPTPCARISHPPAPRQGDSRVRPSTASGR